MSKGKALRGIAAIIEAVDLIGLDDVSDHDLAKVIVDHEPEIRELCTYSLAKLIYQLHPREREDQPTPSSARAMLWAKVEERRRKWRADSEVPMPMISLREAVRIIKEITQLECGGPESTARSTAALISIMAYAMAALEQSAGESP